MGGFYGVFSSLSGGAVRDLAPGREDDHKKVQITMIIIIIARLWFLFCVRRRVFFCPHGRIKTLGSFSPKPEFWIQKIVFLAQKTGFCAGFGVLRSPRGFFVGGYFFSCPP